MTCDLCSNGELYALDLSALAEEPQRFVCVGCGRELPAPFLPEPPEVAQDEAHDDLLERALMPSLQNFQAETTRLQAHGLANGLVPMCCERHAATTGAAVFDSIERRN